MDKKANNQLTILLLAIICLTNAAIYFFILENYMGWKKWLLVGFFAISGLLMFVRYFIDKRKAKS